ncbi:Gfo/Idh/MocA family oxidoreductase [Galactobacter sp.]|uniref:Gfo/Idh/MocA family protein n=1 Tax=Galactobacter sp. TaxID=2676125 RepID=UPI0025B879F0|nr:Gfo/Idh/MocA family oxidoreductase [Galactobacter sp.]
MVKVGLVGYGFGGRVFHAPFIVEAGLQLSGVVARSSAKREQLTTDHPNVPVFDSLTELLAADVADLIVITTPPETHVDLSLEAIAAGTPVIVDKPFAPDAAQAQKVVDAAAAAEVPLGVFHNRRWDPDVRAINAVLDSGELGETWSVHSRFDLDEPDGLEAGPAHGLLRDIGSHLVDQAIFLSGPAISVEASLNEAQKDGFTVDAAFDVTLHHASGVHSHLHSTKLNHLAERSWRVYGAKGAYTQTGTDEFAGGAVHTADGVRPVPGAATNAADYYRLVGQALENGTELPVTGAQGVKVMEVLDAARTSARERRIVALEG